MRCKTLIFLIICCQSVFAQSTEWASVGAKWWWSVSDMDPEGEAYYFWEVTHKDSFMGEWVSVIESDLFGYDSMVVPGYDTLFTFSRNDSVFLFNEYSERFDLLYDFGAEVGDTLQFSTFDNDWWGFDKFLVVVEDIFLFEEGRDRFHRRGNIRRFITRNIDTVAFDWNHIYTEGYGDTYLFLTPNGPSVFGPRLRCYEDQDIEVHFHYKEYSSGLIEDLPCDYYRYSPTKEVVWNSDKIKLYPNPVREFLQVEISTSLKNATFRIIDWVGKARLKGDADLLYSGLDVNTWEPGIYVLVLEDAERIYFQKFMIQR